jgi:hypothetical protein
MACLRVRSDIVVHPLFCLPRNTPDGLFYGHPAVLTTWFPELRRVGRTIKHLMYAVNQTGSDAGRAVERRLSGRQETVRFR